MGKNCYISSKQLHVQCPFMLQNQGVVFCKGWGGGGGLIDAFTSSYVMMGFFFLMVPWSCGATLNYLPILQPC